MNQYFFYTILFSFLFNYSAKSQNPQLANRYFLSGEYEKAAEVYLILSNKSNGNFYYFQKYVESIVALEKYEEAERALKKEMQKSHDNVEVAILYGTILDKMENPEKANIYYKKAIQLINSKDINLINRIGNNLSKYAKYDLAIEAYSKGSNNFENDILFASRIAALYQKKGDIPNAIKYYLIASVQYQNNVNSLIRIFQRMLTKDEYSELQKQLYNKISEDNDNSIYKEILEWTFIYNKQYRKAFRQARSQDMENNENGAKVYNIGQIAYNDHNYLIALECFEYIAKNKDKNSSFYLEANRGYINCKRKLINKKKELSQEDLNSIRSEYTSLLFDMGRNTRTADLMVELAEFEALYLHDIDSAILILQEVISFGGINSVIKDKAKIQLADYMLINNEIWEATLIYSQVDKSQKEGKLGEIARFKNAMLSYYHGDFEWAQEQFSILKHATSKLISNDAIDMSVFILDNLGLDTTKVPLQLFADAELALYQHKYNLAFAKWDTIQTYYENHELTDDILYKKANYYLSKGSYEKAIDAYNIILADYPDGIRADNSIFELAELYEKHLNLPDKAIHLYENLFLDYSGSTFATEARIRYRFLRGDHL